MTSINADELKTFGLAPIENALEKASTVIIHDDNKKFVIMTPMYYEYLRECALIAAMADSKADLAAGRFSVMTASEHVAKVSQAEPE